MLRRLTIQNIALIEELSLGFGKGFLALTGETGAGKSILVDAMNLALGERADRELVRQGADKARVEAIFAVEDNPRAREIMAEYGIEPDDDGTLVVSRELSITGRNAVRIGGVAQPLAALRRLTGAIVDIHGQHEHQSLLDEQRHAQILDACAGEALMPCKDAVAREYAAYQAARQKLRYFSGDARERAQRADMLAFQAKEIRLAKLKGGEEEELRAERDRLRNQEKIVLALAEARTLLSGGERSRGAADALRRAAAQMQGIGAYDERYQQAADRLDEAAYTAEDLALEVGGFELGDADPRRLDAIEQRLDDIKTLLRKYGATIAEVLAYADKAEEELEELNSGEERAKKLEKEIARIRVGLMEACEALSAARSAAAREYGALMQEQLRDLGMERARFLIAVDPPEEGLEEEALSAEGYDKVYFLFSANAGESPRPLSRIASGGEMSRVMLALKSVATGEIPCLIFDEIDTGISGRMAQVVGEKIARLGKQKQVICVTHLPQIACMADGQYLVYKFEEKGRAGTAVRLLDREGRVREIARLVGGADGEEAAAAHAEGMLSAARERKKAL